jgi:hypothetical protein
MFKAGDTVHNWNRSKEGVILKVLSPGRYYVRWDNGCRNPATDDELLVPGRPA